MKKKLLVCSLLLIASITLIGCSSKNSDKDNEEKNKVVDNRVWETNQNPQSTSIKEDAAVAYNLATANKNEDIIPLALIAKNEKNNSYMFLCKSTKDNQTIFKIIIVTTSKNGSAKIDKEVEFDYKSIIQENDTSKKSNSDWKLNDEAEFVYLEENLFSAFINARMKKNKNEYTAIAYIAKSDNNNYAFLSIDKEAKAPTLNLVVIEIGNEEEATIVNDIPLELNDLY